MSVSFEEMLHDVGKLLQGHFVGLTTQVIKTKITCRLDRNSWMQVGIIAGITTQLNEIIVLKYLINIKPKIKLGICCLLETAVLRTTALSLILIG